MSDNSVNYNTIPTSLTAQNAINTYTFLSPRKDFSIDEWNKFKMDWLKFQEVWAYNYTVSTLNGNAGRPLYSTYAFKSNDEKQSVVRGQSAHVTGYPSAFNTFVLPK